MDQGENLHERARRSQYFSVPDHRGGVLEAFGSRFKVQGARLRACQPAVEKSVFVKSHITQLWSTGKNFILYDLTIYEISDIRFPSFVLP
jgi:hypothetical protein